jgi:NADPH:quinone reductase-like Zn-dependent oxidoreductase
VWPHSGFDRSEGVLDRFASLANFLRMFIEPALDGFEDVLVLPSRDPRREDRRDMLLKNGADEVFIDVGEIAPTVRKVHPDGVHRVLELVGTTTLLDSLQCAAMGGSVCMTGMVGNAWEFERFSPMGAIPTAVNLTTYAGGAEDFISTPLQQVVNAVEAGTFTPPIGKTFVIDDIVEAHRVMETNSAGGKIVVTT